MREFCNPINIDYKYQHLGRFAYREAADPTMIYFKGKYYLFPSMSAGFYYSDDLAEWKWHENRNVDMYRYAPDVRQVGDYMYFCASSLGEPSAIWRTADPMSDQFEKISEPFPFWDPDLFCDDDGKVYLYYGCSNSKPLYGVELDRDTMKAKGRPVPISYFDIKAHGFERAGYPGRKEDLSGSKETYGLLIKLLEKILKTDENPFFEGAYVNKFNGKYYLQYAAPGSSLPTYGDGVAVSDSPLGPFETCSNTPYSFKPKGFINGAGHGSTIEDHYGNLWHTSTMRIYVNAEFERRVGLWPAGVDEDGYLFCNQNFGDYPLVIPEGRFDPKKILPHYMLLSYKKKAKASSELEGHPVQLAVDENVRTWWCARGMAQEWYELDLGEIYKVHSVQLNLADEEIPSEKHAKEDCCPAKIPASVGRRFVESGKDFRTQFILEGSLDGENWIILKDASHAETNLPHDYIILPEDTNLRYVKVTCLKLPYHAKFAISGLRVFGFGNGKAPEQVRDSSAVRSSDLDADICWENVENAMGYNVRIGIAPDKLYNSYQIYEETQVKITSLNKGVEYWYCIDSYNESGITEGIVKKL